VCSIVEFNVIIIKCVIKLVEFGVMAAEGGVFWLYWV